MTGKNKSLADEWRKKLRDRRKDKSLNEEQKDALDRLEALNDEEILGLLRNPSIQRMIGLS